MGDGKFLQQELFDKDGLSTADNEASHHSEHSSKVESPNNRLSSNEEECLSGQKLDRSKDSSNNVVD